MGLCSVCFKYLVSGTSCYKCEKIIHEKCSIRNDKETSDKNGEKETMCKNCFINQRRRAPNINRMCNELSMKNNVTPISIENEYLVKVKTDCIKKHVSEIKIQKPEPTEYKTVNQENVLDIKRVTNVTNLQNNVQKNLSRGAILSRLFNEFSMKKKLSTNQMKTEIDKTVHNVKHCSEIKTVKPEVTEYKTVKEENDLGKKHVTNVGNSQNNIKNEPNFMRVPNIFKKKDYENCGICSLKIDDGIRCLECETWYHFNCAGTTKEEYGMIESKKEVWLCHACEFNLEHNDNVNDKAKETEYMKTEVDSEKADNSIKNNKATEVKVKADSTRKLKEINNNLSSKTDNNVHTVNKETVNNFTAIVQEIKPKISRKQQLNLNKKIFELRPECEFTRPGKKNKDAKLKEVVLTDENIPKTPHYVMITGIVYDENENLTKKVQELGLVQELDITNKDLYYVIRLKDKPDQVIVAFKDEELKSQFLKIDDFLPKHIGFGKIPIRLKDYPKMRIIGMNVETKLGWMLKEINVSALSNAANAVQCHGKSPVSALNELGVRVSYSIERSVGPAHCPHFTVSVNVADMKFEGWGHSKREARASAARSCLQALLARAGRVLTTPLPKHHDFSADVTAKFPTSEFQVFNEPMKPLAIKQSPTPSVVTKSAVTTPADSPSTSLFGVPAVKDVSKSAINRLYENYPGLNFVCTHGDGTSLDSGPVPQQLNHSMRFKVTCEIQDKVFEGFGSSKKLAKMAAARAALSVLDEGAINDDMNSQDTDPNNSIQQTMYDKICKMVNEKFYELMANDVVHSKRKVLAGIVITNNNDPNDIRVISVTTGTKCISGGHISVRGLAVNDSHAEIVARRGLHRHLYRQLAMYVDAKDPRKPIENCDLEPLPNGGYKLKDNLSVHLYVSTAPCGDGRIFSPHEPEPDRHPNRMARGQLRNKIESGEGTIPVKNSDNSLQTWDGVMQGERLLTMSCSDKVARWCVNGLQGSLLSTFIRPIYLTSVVLGSLLHQHHLNRALYGRIENHIDALPSPFKLHRPLLASSASIEPRTPARAPSFAVAWTCGDQSPEIVNTTTGKLDNDQPSLLCKQSMFARWLYLIKRLKPLPQDPNFAVNFPQNIDTIPYCEAKQLCRPYQISKQRLYEAFERAKLGMWVKKPLEQDQFSCELTDAQPSALFA